MVKSVSTLATMNSVLLDKIQRNIESGIIDRVCLSKETATVDEFKESCIIAFLEIIALRKVIVEVKNELFRGWEHGRAKSEHR